MKRIELETVPHSVKIGDKCPEIEPTVTNDAIFYDQGGLVGFYMSHLPDKLQRFINIANAELLSERVPKQEMRQQER